MYRGGAKPRQATQDAYTGQHQILDWRFVLQRAPFAVGGNRAANETGVNLCQPFRGDQFLAVRTWRKILDQHVRARHQIPERGSIRRRPGRQIVIQIKHHAFLAAIPNDEAVVAERRRRPFDNTNDPGSLIAQQHGAQRRRRTGA